MQVNNVEKVCTKEIFFCTEPSQRSDCKIYLKKHTFRVIQSEGRKLTPRTATYRIPTADTRYIRYGPTTRLWNVFE